MENNVTNSPFFVNGDNRLASAPVGVHMQIAGPDALRSACLSVAMYQAQSIRVVFQSSARLMRILHGWLLKLFHQWTDENEVAILTSRRQSRRLMDSLLGDSKRQSYMIFALADLKTSLC